MMVDCPNCKKNNVMVITYNSINKNYTFECQDCEHIFEDIITVKEE